MGTRLHCWHIIHLFIHSYLSWWWLWQLLSVLGPNSKWIWDTPTKCTRDDSTEHSQGICQPCTHGQPLSGEVKCSEFKCTTRQTSVTRCLFFLPFIDLIQAHSTVRALFRHPYFCMSLCLCSKDSRRQIQVIPCSIQLSFHQYYYA